MNSKENPPFDIGSRPEAKEALEKLKNKLIGAESFEKEASKEVPRPVKDVQPQRRFVATSVTGTEGGKIGMVMRPSVGEQFRAVSGSEKFPTHLNKYDKIAEGNETDEELKARISKEHAEVQEERTKVANKAVQNLGNDPGFAEVAEVFERRTPETKPLEAKPEVKAEMKSEVSQEKQNLAEEALVPEKEIQEAAEKFQGSVAEKKKILEDLKKETNPDRKKQLWHEKNYTTLEHQRNWAAFAYENALNETQKKQAEEDFKQAKKMLEEYMNDPDAYEKKNKWEYMASATIHSTVAEEKEKAVPETEEVKKEPLTRIKQLESGLPIQQVITEPIVSHGVLTEEYKPTFSIAEELERSFRKQNTAEEDAAALENARVERLKIEDGWLKEIEARGKEKNHENNNVNEPKENVKIGGENKYTKTLEVTPEELERIQKLKESLENQEKQIEKDAEGKGYLDTIRKIGENYKKARLTYKGALALAILAGVSSGGVAALLGVGFGFAARVGGGAAAFVGVEAILEKKRQEKERWWNKNPKIMAAIPAGIIIFSGAIGKTISATGADEWLSHMWGKVFGGAEVAQSALERAHGEIIPPPPAVSAMALDVKTALEQAHEAILPPEAPLGAEEVVKAASVAATEGVHTVASGENLHHLIGGMKELSELDGGRKENAIANIIVQINKNPAEYGIASGDIDHLAVGDHIDMEKIHQAFEQTKIGGESVIEHAKHLTTEQVAHIEMPQISSEEFESPLDKSVSELEKAHAKIPSFEELDKIGQPATSVHPAGLNVLDINDHAIANMNATEELPSVAQRHLEDIFGVGVRELGDTDWVALQGEDAEDFLDDFSLDTDSPEEKLRAYLNDIVDNTKIKPNAEETILDYIKRASEEDPRVHFINT